mmetsp:Transcript_13168/g.37897  ORF Transcript_13168/g.37897 Transcript_13168/m.37897 type:complete len:205 (+) Transcript_13168:1631-2245(+)
MVRPPAGSPRRQSQPPASTPRGRSPRPYTWPSWPRARPPTCRAARPATSRRGGRTPRNLRTPRPRPPPPPRWAPRQPPSASRNLPCTAYLPRRRHPCWRCTGCTSSAGRLRRSRQLGNRRPHSTKGRNTSRCSRRALCSKSPTPSQDPTTCSNSRRRAEDTPSRSPCQNGYPTPSCCPCTGRICYGGSSPRRLCRGTTRTSRTR